MRIIRSSMALSMDGDIRGRIFVDNQASPRSALVWAEHEIFFLIGDPFNRSFVKALPKLIKEQIMPASFCHMANLFSVNDFRKWLAQIESYLDEFIPKYYDRISFTFKPHSNQQLPDWRKRVPRYYRVQKIDAELLADPDAEVVHNVVHRYWRSEELFLKHGIGYVVRKGKKVISCCLSTFASETDIEVGIQTFQPKDRKRGLATLAARALLDECIRQQRTPHWKTESFRLASIRLAQKVGFADKTVYRAYYFFYDPLDNLVFSAYHRLKEMGDMAEAAMYIDQAKSYGTILFISLSWRVVTLQLKNWISDWNIFAVLLKEDGDTISVMSDLNVICRIYGGSMRDTISLCNYQGIKRKESCFLPRVIS